MRRCEWCDFETIHRSSLSTHKKRCKLRPDENRVEAELRERVLSLEQQLMANDKQLQAKDQQLRAKDEQLTAKDEQLKRQNEHIANLEVVISQQLAETKDELRKTKKRKDSYADKTAGRRTRTEPERRKVAMRQHWKCANPDGKCILPGLLEEYDVDHRIPLWKGGSEEPENLQALCPACHRRKTEKENKERNATGRVTDTLLQVPVWSTDY